VGDFFLTLATDYRRPFLYLYVWALFTHVFEAVVAFVICVRLDLDFETTVKWTANVLVHGLFALRFLWARHAKDNFDDSKSKKKS
jgi:hypothetical protein